jgi:hypothetical protein
LGGRRGEKKTVRKLRRNVGRYSRCIHFFFLSLFLDHFFYFVLLIFHLGLLLLLLLLIHTFRLHRKDRGRGQVVDHNEGGQAMRKAHASLFGHGFYHQGVMGEALGELKKETRIQEDDDVGGEVRENTRLKKISQ